MAHVKHGVGLHYCYPTIPHALLLPCPLRPGAEISIQGKVPTRTRRFSFNLQKGTDKKTSDVVFHFNPRLEEGSVVVRNARAEGSWGEEERDFEAEFPFAHKADFRVVIQATEECYKVVVNGNHFIDFKHRFPLDYATHFCTKGEIKIFNVSFPMPLPTRLIASIPGNMKLGDIIFVNGKASDSSARFRVNFQCGPAEEDDVVLHVNPRFDEGVIVRNSRLADQWGSEETGGGFPISANDKFTLALAALQDRYQIYLNGNHFANFNYRTPVESACTLLVDGAVNLENVIVESPAHKVYPPTGGKQIRPERVLTQEFNPNLPASIPIPGGMTAGRLVLVTGMPANNCSKFEINFQNGPGDGGNTLLHFNPRFDDGPNVVRNARLGGSWGGEETDGPFPFEKGAHFDVVFISEPNEMQVWINGENFCTFVHRDAPDFADHLYLSGNVFIKRVLIA